MTKTPIIVIMEQFVTVTIVTVIMMTYRKNSMEKKKKTQKDKPNFIC